MTAFIDQDDQLEHEILRLLSARSAGKTICPSEAARGAAGSDDRTKWEPLMGPAHDAAHRLVAAGKIVITQHGVAVDSRTAKGPIRLRLR
jgi:hypothetical protein